MEFAFFPHARRPQRAQPVRIFSRTLASDWVVSEIESHVGDFNWSRPKSLGAIADILTSLGNWRFHLYTTAGMAQEWFEL